MYYNRDPWTQKKAYVLELYLQGKSPAVISGLTGVPRIRIERELNRLTERRPELPLPLDEDIHVAAGLLADDGVDYALALEAAEAREEEHWHK